MIMKIPTNDWYEQYDYEDEFDAESEIIENDPDFTEYLWMENEEEFDKLEMQRLEEESLMKECLEAMLEDELEAELAQLENANAEDICIVLASLSVSANIEKSTLNPLAEEFVPINSNFSEILDQNIAVI